MPTPPRAKRYRIRRPDPAAVTPRPEPAAAAVDDGFGAGPYPTAAAAGPQVLAPSERTAEEELAAIRAEGLTGRQLRLARRVAQRHGVEAASDFEAVRILRKRGIDPFERSVAMGVGAPAVALPARDGGRVQLPQMARNAEKLPTPDLMTEGDRALAIMRVQRDIARRRRRKLALLFTRLAFFVLLPTLVAGYYFYAVATPLYATKTEFVIQQADSASSAGGGLGGLLSQSPLGAAQDSMTVQSYLQSREAMLRLDREIGFRSHFSAAGIDPITRLDPGASNEAAYRLYARTVKIGFDPTEGIVKMEVVAADPDTSVRYSQALLGYAEEQVDQLTQRLRADQMSGAEQSVADAEAKVKEAQDRVQTLQEQVGVLDPASETSAVMGRVSQLETELTKKKLELAQLLDNPAPNQARVDGARGDIKRLEDEIAAARSGLTAGAGGVASLAAVTGQLRIAEADLETRLLMLSQAMQQREAARIEANKQVRYITAGVRPVAPDEATYPRAFENTLISLLLFAGIYLMLSLTASILREQVSA